MFEEMGKSLDERWVHRSPEDMFRSVLATNDERFPMICADLRAMPRRPMILVEGPRLFPKLVAPLLTDPHQAVWLMPTEDFARRSTAARDKPQGRFDSSDSERFRHNFLRRDALLAEHIRREATRLGLPLIEVDGLRSAEEMATLIEAHFAPYLASRQGS
jgi:hypothetical protein